jgi:hypothetical protein
VQKIETFIKNREPGKGPAIALNLVVSGVGSSSKAGTPTVTQGPPPNP